MTILDFLSTLIAYRSITPNDANCQDFIQLELEKLGFVCHRYNCDPVSNLFARYGTKPPFFMFAGHTDVVPPGDEKKWHTPPFEMQRNLNHLYGRGIADMKGSIAAMWHAVKRFLEQYGSSFEGSIGFLITSGEEGNDFDKGTPWVMKKLHAENQLPQYCLVGEPSSQKKTGDMIKIGRRGSLSGELTIHGKQGHVAYPHLAQNPIHIALHALSELVTTHWDQGNAYFPETTLQITHIQAGGEASNVIPGTLTLHFNLRYSTEQTAQGLIDKIETLLQKNDLSFNILWRDNGHPFLTHHGQLLEKTIESIQENQSFLPECSTSGGTSDARFIAPYHIEVIELGLCHHSIHQANEHICIDDLMTLEILYFDIIKKLFHICNT